MDHFKNMPPKGAWGDKRHGQIRGVKLGSNEPDPNNNNKLFSAIKTDIKLYKTCTIQ